MKYQILAVLVLLQAFVAVQNSLTKVHIKEKFLRLSNS